jgi:hypothetical protein
MSPGSEREQFDRVRETVREQLAAMRERTLGMLERIDSRLRPLDEAESDARDALEAMDRASAKVPLGMVAYRYTKGMVRARGPAVHIDGGLSDEYEEISEEAVETLKARFMNDALAAFDDVYQPAAELLNDVQNEALTLRYFSGSEPLLERFAVVLAQPWHEAVRTDDLTPKSFRLHWYYATLPYRVPPHAEIIARRRASIGTLHLLRAKLSALRSLIETVLTEITFAQPRTEPAAVPATWNDYSVNIAQGVSVEGSAIGSGSNLRSGRLL